MLKSTAHSVAYPLKLIFDMSISTVVSRSQPLPLYKKEGSGGLLSYVSFEVIPYNRSEISGCYTRAEFQDVR